MSVILKSPGEIEAMKAAGQLSAEVLRKVGELVKPGVSTLELDEFAETYIREHGGIPGIQGVWWISGDDLRIGKRANRSWHSLEKGCAPRRRYP